MKLIVCVDDKLGMLYNKRRQSKDRLLRADMLEVTRGSKLWMNAYSAGQFEDASNICIDEDFLEKAGPEEYCFVENADIVPYADGVRGVIVYRWNRTYPSDRKFPMELFADSWKQADAVDFAGSSHDTITREVYEL